MTVLAASRLLDIPGHGLIIVCAIDAIFILDFVYHHFPWALFATKVRFARRSSTDIYPALLYCLSSYTFPITLTLQAHLRDTLPSVSRTRYSKLPSALKSKTPQASADLTILHILI